MKFDQITGFKGLSLQPNTFEIPKGYLEVAENINIEDKDTITKCRGYYTYFDPSLNFISVSASAVSDVITVTSISHGLTTGMTVSVQNAAGFAVSSNVDGSLIPVIFIDLNTFTYIAPGGAPGGGPGTLEYRSDNESIINITSFDTKLLAVYDNRMSYYSNVLPMSLNETGVEVHIPQDAAASISYRVIDYPAFEKANGNLYTTADQGVIKLTNFNDNIYQSGAPQALDLDGNFDIGTSATWWNINTASPGGKQVAYRILFGYQDFNNNLILSAPSGYFSIINNSVVPDTPTNNASAAGAVVTVTSVAHGLSDGMQLFFFDASVFITPTNIEGYATISVTGVDTFKYTAPGGAPGGGPGKVSYALAMQVRLEFTVPSQISTNINTGWFYQIYRSSQVSIAVSIQSDFALIAQRFLTQTELDNHIAFFNDDVSEFFKGALLYVNQNSGEGELQANFRAPQCQSMSLYQKYLFYGNCRTRQLLNFSVSGPINFSTTSYIETKVGDIVRRYYVASGPGNLTVRASITAIGPIVVNYTAHGIPTVGLNTVYISNTVVTIGGFPINGNYYAINVAANTFEITDTIGGAALVGVGAVPSPCDFESVYQSKATQAASWVRTSNVITVTLAAHGLSIGMQVYISGSAGGAPNIVTNIYTIQSVPNANDFTVNESAADSNGTCSYNELDYVFYDNNIATATPSEQIRDSSVTLVKAINRDAYSLVYAQYTSAPNDTSGNIRLQAKNFGDPIYLRVSDLNTQKGFFPQIPIVYTGPDQVFSEDEILLNTVFFSKLQEPEAVPLVNFIKVGSEKAQILNIHSLTNSLIILKEDGVFRLTGDNPSNFVVSVLDNTVNIVARRSSTTFANQVAALTNQGVVLVSETSVQIISRIIENVIQTIVNNGAIDFETIGVSYEIDRQYLITTLAPDGQTKVNYCYNVMTDAWTTWTWTFRSASIGPDNIMYMVESNQGKILRERKNNNKIDYCGQYHDVTVLDASDTSLVLISSLSYTPQYGDIIVKNSIINIIVGVTNQNPGEYYVDFLYPSNLLTLDFATLYEKYVSTIRLTPYTGGQVGIGKQFSQMQLHFRDYSCNVLDIDYSNDTYYNSTPVRWETRLVGQNNTIDIEYTTRPSAICRVYVSRQAQRNTFLQPIIQNLIAGDRIDLQSINIAVRSYGERVSR